MLILLRSFQTRPSNRKQPLNWSKSIKKIVEQRRREYSGVLVVASEGALIAYIYA